jgi:hypothetical protein
MDFKSAPPPRPFRIPALKLCSLSPGAAFRSALPQLKKNMGQIKHNWKNLVRLPRFDTHQAQSLFFKIVLECSSDIYFAPPIFVLSIHSQPKPNSLPSK